jgi:hypothetical protein
MDTKIPQYIIDYREKEKILIIPIIIGQNIIYKKAAAGELRSPAAAKYLQTELFLFFSCCFFFVICFISRFRFISKTGFCHFS